MTIFQRTTAKGAIGFMISIAMFFAISVFPAFAVSTAIWEQKTKEDFEAGKPKDVSISSKGEVSLSLKLNAYVETEEAYIWCLAEDSQGNIYAGTGNEGRIFKIAPDGTSSLFFDSPEVNIYSLAVDSSNNLYAGTSPDGLVYKISPDGTASTLLSAKEKYVWALVFDNAGNLYAGTGTNGKIYKITPDGQNSVLYDSETTHIMSLHYSPLLGGVGVGSDQNVLYAGSEGNGIIYKIPLPPLGKGDNKITLAGHASVVYDTNEKEIHALTMDPHGNLYAAATSGKMPGEEQRRELPPPPGPGGEAPKEKESSIYKVTPDGVVSKLWTASEPLILSMVVDAVAEVARLQVEGSGGHFPYLIVGTGDEGKIYTVNADGDSASIAKGEEAQVLAIHKTKTGGMLVATGNNGKIYRLSTDHAPEGTLESKVYDAKIISKWGNIEWEQVIPEGTAISFATRTGNNSKPDNTWSEWSEEYTAADGQKVTHSPARFIQYRAKLTTTNPLAAPMFKRVAIAYAQTNIAPKITSIETDSQKGDEEGGERPPGGQPRQAAKPPAGQAPVPSPKRTVKWQVTDANEDAMEYAVYYKGVDEQTWKLLKDELKTNSYSWDSTSMPDGRYQIKIVATDKLSNPVNLAKTTEKISDQFEIDNTQPTISEITVTSAANGAFQVKCAAEDKINHIKEAVFSIDGQDWQMVFPVDGIFDSRTEAFDFTTPSDLKVGEHTVVVKIVDTAGNVSSGKQIFTK
ncbi:hypothetical protein FJZ31_29120 [Candidatus Poribacteria bacterium]|nr:hypothetical protein [Candidatus Poribacteria bacterium]